MLERNERRREDSRANAAERGNAGMRTEAPAQADAEGRVGAGERARAARRTDAERRNYAQRPKGAQRRRAACASAQRSGGKIVRRARRRGERRHVGRRIALLLTSVVALIALAYVGALTLGRNRPPVQQEEELPVAYEQIIYQYADKNDIPPAYIAAVILAESSYNSDAVSSADARGLMQLLPSTAEWIAGKLGEVYNEDQLFDPETNIRYGSWYLGFLMKRYDGDMRCSSAAYHAGQGTVDNWLSDSRYSEDGETLAVIASSVTNTYVSRVLKNYEKYAEIYGAQI